MSEKFIDLDKVIADKNPKLAKQLPGFLLRYLKKIVHQDQINAFIEKNRQKYDFDFAAAILDEFGVKVEVEGLDNIPTEGRFLLVANHPLGGLDGIALISSAGKARKDIRFPVNDILMHLDNLKNLFIPVNKHGSNLENKKLFEQTFASDNTVLYFPAGLVSRKQEGEIKDLKWHKTFVTLSKRYERDVIPVYVDAKNSHFFYNLAYWRKRLGVKANLEMLYLVDEMYKQRNKTIRIYFGKPISFSTFDESKKDVQWAAEVKELVYQLKENKNAKLLM